MKPANGHTITLAEYQREKWVEHHRRYMSVKPSPRGTPCLALVPVVLFAMVLLSGCMSGQPPVPAPETAPAPGLTFYTEQNPPYNYEENGTLKGIAVDLLEEMTARAGSRVDRSQVRLVPWTEGYQAVLHQNRTVLFTTVRLPERESSFKWVGPVYPYTNVLFSRQDNNFTLRGVEDPGPLKIGVIRDDIAGIQLMAMGMNESQLVKETSVREIIRKLESGEIDLWGYPEPSGRYFAQQVTGNASTFRVVYTLPGLDGYYAFSRDTPDSTVEAFQKALDSLKQEKDASGRSRYEEIVWRYIPSSGV